MGLNFVIACHRCRVSMWMFRYEESVPLHGFYREHWEHSEEVELGNDQGDRAWESGDAGYEDVGAQFGVDDPPRSPWSPLWVGTGGVRLLGS